MSNLTSLEAGIIGSDNNSTSIKWELNEGEFRSFIDTVKNVLINYKEFFKQSYKKNEYYLPALFAIICQSIGFVLGIFTTGLLNTDKATLSFFAITVIFLPAIIGISLFINTWFLKFGGKIIFRIDLPYAAIFRVVAYGSAPYLFSIGSIGNFAAIFWSILIQLNGIKAITGLDTFRSITLLFFPFLILLLFSQLYGILSTVF